MYNKLHNFLEKKKKNQYCLQFGIYQKHSNNSVKSINKQDGDLKIKLNGKHSVKQIQSNIWEFILAKV